MSLPNIFKKETCEILIQRIEKLTPITNNEWGKMNVSQMLAHCNVTYEMAFEDIHPKPNFLMEIILKLFVKNSVVNEVPYKKESPTAPAFIIKNEKNFENEKERLKKYILKSQELGENYFDGKPSLSFGKLTKTEWNNLLYKHLDHHLKQFGV
ncbi:MAG: DUF1569 domain-containing protein [Cytophagales bacterium]|nr:MAG: DUF1569 domain-containing protein [Cytophagales bacterium]